MDRPDFKRAAPTAGVPGSDYFALLGLPARFDIDLGALERSYLERSREIHPDRFVTAPARERVEALQRSMQLNDAYKTLKKPLPRAEYLLAQRGVTIEDNEVLDPEFLMEVLELREELAEAKAARDESSLRRLEAAMIERHQATLAAVGRLFARLEQEGGGDAQAVTILAELKSHVIVLRYIRRYLEEFEDVYDDE